MISGINSTLTTALALWQSTPNSDAISQNAATANTNTSSIDPRNSAQSSIDQIFAILKAANSQSSGVVSSQTVTSAYEAETTKSNNLTIGTSSSVTVSLSTGLAQVSDSVAQINAGLQTVLGPSAIQVSGADSVAVSLGNVPSSSDVGLPQDATKPTDFMQALNMLAQSSNAGVSAAASSLAGRIQNVQGDGLGDGQVGVTWMGGPEAMLEGSDNATAMLATVMGDRDTRVIEMANDLVAGSSGSLSDDARFLSATYNGSFSIVDVSSLQSLSERSQTNFFNATAQDIIGYGSSKNLWAFVYNDPTVSMTTSVSINSNTAAA